MRFFLIGLFLLTIAPAHALRVYQASTMGEAHVRVAIVGNRGEADALVHRVSSWGMASGSYRWYITRDRQDADIWIYFTSPGFAQCKVMFVDSLGEAGAVNSTGRNCLNRR